MARIADFVTRAEWGCDESLMTWQPEFYDLQKLTTHHAVTQNGDPDPAATVNSIYEYHAVDRGYGDIGYHALVDEDGRIYEGRYTGDSTDVGHGGTGDQQVTAAHTSGSNSGNYGVCLLGTFDTVNPTASARDSLERYYADLCDRHNLDPEGTSDYTNPVNGSVVSAMPNISGHRDWTTTDCPGDELYNDLPSIRTNVASLQTTDSGGGGATTGAPVTLPSGQYPQRPSNVGPFVVGTDLYVLMISSTTDLGDLRCFKSTDGGANWTDQGAWNKGADEIAAVWAEHDPNSGHLRCVIQDIGGFVAYKAYDLATDAWSTAAGQGLGTYSTSVFGVALTVRSDSSLVAMFQGSTEQIGKGKTATNRNRIQWATRSTGGTWTNQGDLDGAGVDADYYVGAAVLGGSDRSHLFYTGGGTLKHVGVSSLNVLGTGADVDTTLGTATNPVGGAVHDTTGGEIVVPYLDGDGTVAVARASSGVLDLGSFTIDVAVSDQAAAVVQNGVVAGLTEIAGDVHLLYADSATSDLWRDVRTVGAWGTDVEALDAVTVERVSVSDDGTDLLVVFSDAGTPKFARITLGDGSTTVDASPASVRANSYDGGIAASVAGEASTATTAAHDATSEIVEPAVTVDADVAAVTLSGFDATTDTAATVDADAAVAGASSFDAAGEPGPFDVSAGQAALTVTGQDADRDGNVGVDATAAPAGSSSFDATTDPGPAGSDATAAGLTAAGHDAAVTVTVGGDAAAATLTGQDATVAPGPVAQDASAASVTSASPDATSDPGPSGADATAASTAASSADATVDTSGGPQTVDATAAPISATSSDATTATGGEVTTDPATVTSSSFDADATAGPATADADPALLTLSPTDADVDASSGADADPLSVTLSANSATNTPGPSAADADPAVLTLAGQDATVGGGGTADADPATLNLTSTDPSPEAGPIGVDADPASILFAAQSADTGSDGLADTANITAGGHDATVDQHVDADPAPATAGSADATPDSTSRADATHGPVSVGATDAEPLAGDPTPTALHGAVSTGSGDATALPGPTGADGGVGGLTVAAYDASADTEGQVTADPATLTTGSGDATTGQVADTTTASALFDALDAAAGYTVGGDGATLGIAAYDAGTETAATVGADPAPTTVAANDADTAAGPTTADAEQVGLVTATGGQSGYAEHADQAQLIAAAYDAAVDQATRRLNVLLSIGANDAGADPGPTVGDAGHLTIVTTAPDADSTSTFGREPERITVEGTRTTATVTTDGPNRSTVEEIRQTATVTTGGPDRITVSTGPTPLTITT